MKEHDATFLESEYEQLPPALRRKYFSSLERLRLAQDGACPIYPSRSQREPQRPLTSSNSSSFSTKRSFRRPSTPFDDSSLTSSIANRSKLRKASRPVSISPQQIAQFASLPPVLRRKQFSREEQVVLASRINHVILDAADEALYKQYGPIPRPSTTYREFASNELDLFETESEDEMEMNQDELSSLQWLDGDDDLDLSLDNYHAAIAETSQSATTSPRRTSFRKALRASNLSFPRRSSSINSSTGQVSWPLPSPTSTSAHLKVYRPPQPSVGGGHRRNRASTSSLEPCAAHYQDPAARMKLRVYLASPQKFDEAIEFGFPSMQEPNLLRVVRPTPSARTTDSIDHILVNDDTPSLSEGDDHEIDALDSPRTPEVPAFSPTFSKSKDSSLDRSSIKPKVVREFVDPYVHALASHREMTLHMTLTRPDLRSPEELTSPQDVNARPLEQAPLDFSNDTGAGFWDSLPDSESKVKKLFRKLKLRP